MRSLFEWKSLLLALSVIFALGVVGCDDDDETTTDTGTDQGQDMVPDVVDDAEEDTGEDVVPDTPAPLNLCFVGETPQVDETLSGAIGSAAGICGGGPCFDCAIGVATGTGTAACGDVAACTGDPNEGACAMSTCVVSCIRDNDFGPCDASDQCVDDEDNVIPYLTCNTDDDVCEAPVLSTINDSDVDDNCLYCYGLITGCISQGGVLLATTCAADSGSCACETGQCENDCVDNFVYCSGLPPYIDCDNIESCEE